MAPSWMRWKARSKGKPYIAGDRFSAADVYVGSHLGFGMQFGTIEKRKVFEDYWARLDGTPGLQARESNSTMRRCRRRPDAALAGDRAQAVAFFLSHSNDFASLPATE